jgi:hypothetical protein
MQVWDGELRLDLSVTDLRLYADDGARPDTARVREIAARLDHGVPALLGVGLTRPFASRPNEAPVHWLQVNNIHLEDDPAWRLSTSGGDSSAHMARPLTRAGAGVSVARDKLPF